MKKILLYFFLLVSCALRAEIFEARHFKDIYQHIDYETLILVDIDDTLLIPVQMLGCDEWFTTRLCYYHNQGFNASDGLEKALAEFEAVRHLTKMELVEPETAIIVSHLQNQGFCLMGLTTQGLALATRTKLQLFENGIDLVRTAPSCEDHYFTVDDHGVLFRAGILFTSGSHKGKALFNFLEKLCYRPRRILFINDKLSHLEQVETTLKQMGIQFIGLRYAYSDRQKAAFNQEIADYQFSHSNFTHILSDEEASFHLNH